jgi:TolB-like protein
MMAAEQLPSNTPEESQHSEKKVVLVVLPFDNLSVSPSPL